MTIGNPVYALGHSDQELERLGAQARLIEPITRRYFGDAGIGIAPELLPRIFDLFVQAEHSLDRANGGLGIDLGDYQTTTNDICDADVGANRLQNFPVLTQAVSGNGIGVRGALNSKPNSVFALQFLASPGCDPSGYGEGQILLGQTTLATGASCATNFVAALPGSIPAGYVVTATATDSANNTSEFSACVTVVTAPSLAITAAANHQLNLAWSISPSGFVLKQTDSLSPPIQWTTATNVPVLNNGQLTVTVSPTTGSRFYRLSFE